MNRLLLYGFIAAFTLFLLLGTIASKVEWVAAYYWWILWLNVLVVAVLAVGTGTQLWHLWRDIRRQQHGAKLARRLFAILALTSIIPSLVVYALSYRFLDSAIESWFSLEIDKTVSEGVNLAKWVSNEESRRLVNAANALAQTLSTMTAQQRKEEINQWREVLEVEEIALFGESLKTLSYSHRDRYTLAPNLPEVIHIRDIQFRAIARLENNMPFDQHSPQWRVLIKVADSTTNNSIPAFTTPSQTSSIGNLSNPTNQGLYLQIIQPVSERIYQSSRELASAYQRYGELQQGRDGLKSLFLTALTILFVLTIISALSLAYHYSQRFVQPLAILIEGTRAAAKGEFDRRLLEGNSNHDEFDQLIMSFNDMMSDLSESKSSAERAQIDMANSRSFLENVLNHINAGVIIINAEHSALDIISVNSAAFRLLGVDLSGMVNRGVHELGLLAPALRPLAQGVIQAIAAIDEETQERRSQDWSRQLELRLPSGFRTFMLRGTCLPDSSRWVVVFDDISDLLRAQNLHIWSDMARRLAHEIKNPLTPIQLSAERILIKIAEKLPEQVDRDFLERSIGTIVSQVDAIKTLVNQFREMARPASTQLEMFRVNDLLQEVVALYDDKRISLSMPKKSQKVYADRHQLRQVLHNLILNAEQANMEKWGEWSQSRVRLSLTEGEPDAPETILEGNATGIWITVADIGGGFQQSMIDRAFEPNVTTKIKGSGLGLSIVRKIIEEHGGRILIRNDHWQGGAEDHRWDDISARGEAMTGAMVLMWLPLSRDGKDAKNGQAITRLKPVTG
jgi:nitrogen fixation/metabolism regulation signal transduction histidine kinase